MSTLLEILKYIIPALVVFVTVYYLMKTHLDGQLRMKAMEFQNKRTGENLPLKLQAYERLALFCERIRFSNLMFRLSSASISNEELAQAMFISIQKEYEHNNSQQIFVSEPLWKIISLAKNDTLAMINEAIGKEGDLYTNISQQLSQKDVDPIDHALSAIRKEVSIHLQ
jgi:hypothetical protein